MNLKKLNSRPHTTDFTSSLVAGSFLEGKSPAISEKSRLVKHYSMWPDEFQCSVTFSTFAVVMFGMSQVPICLPHPKSEDRKNCVQEYGYPKWMAYNGKSMKILLKWMIWGYHYFWKHP